MTKREPDPDLKYVVTKRYDPSEFIITLSKYKPDISFNWCADLMGPNGITQRVFHDSRSSCLILARTRIIGICFPNTKPKECA